MAILVHNLPSLYFYFLFVLSSPQCRFCPVRLQRIEMLVGQNMMDECQRVNECGRSFWAPSPSGMCQSFTFNVQIQHDAIHTAMMSIHLCSVCLFPAFSFKDKVVTMAKMRPG